MAGNIKRTIYVSDETFDGLTRSSGLCMRLERTDYETMYTNFPIIRKIRFPWIIIRIRKTINEMTSFGDCFSVNS
jgi:hypothetical protein